MGLTRSEQWTLIAVVALVAGGFAVQHYQTRRNGPVVWVEAGQRWEAAPLGPESATRASELRPVLPDSGTSTSSTRESPGAGSVPETSRIVRDPEPTSRDITSGHLALDLNTANRGQLELLPGIGPVKAQAILTYRLEHGRFTTVDALLEIKGIGPKTLEALRPLVRTAPNQPSLAPSAPLSAEKGRSPGYQSGDIEVKPILIDVNRASSEQLQTLDGIGPVLARRIIESRLKGRFRSVDELQRVRGIGPKTIEGLRSSVVVR